MANKKSEQSCKKPSNVKTKVAQEHHFKSISEACANIDGKFGKEQPTITQSCATPPRPTRGSDKKD